MLRRYAATLAAATLFGVGALALAAPAAASGHRPGHGGPGSHQHAHQGSHQHAHRGSHLHAHRGSHRSPTHRAQHPYRPTTLIGPADHDLVPIVIKHVVHIAHTVGTTLGSAGHQVAAPILAPSSAPASTSPVTKPSPSVRQVAHTATPRPPALATPPRVSTATPPVRHAGGTEHATHSAAPAPAPSVSVTTPAPAEPTHRTAPRALDLPGFGSISPTTALLILAAIALATLGIMVYVVRIGRRDDPSSTNA